MALAVNIDEVLQGRAVEWERMEFKQDWNPVDVLQTLCAFANDFHNLDGGYIFVGVAEADGKALLPPVGLAQSRLDGLQKEVLNLGHKIIPAYHPIIEPCLVDGRYVLALRAPGGQNRPYKTPVSLAKDNRETAYYIRKGSTTVKATRDDEIELLSLAAQIPFDDRMNQRADVRDMKLPLIKAFLQDVGSALAAQADILPFEELCRKMFLVDGPPEFVRPRNVGLMFFNDEPGRFFGQTQIDVVIFPEGTGGNRIEERIFRGPLSQMLGDALRFISNGIIAQYVQKHSDRAEADRFFNYPYAAIEEILVNAVYHRSYETREPIEVRVHADHITITSYPGPDRSISLTDLKKGRLVARRYRNRRIGEFLKELHLTEGRGTGIPKVINAMRENGSPMPSFATDEDRTYFTATLPIHRRATPQANTQVSTQVNTEATPQVVTLLLYCETARNRAGIQARLRMKSAKNLRERYLRPAIEAGWLVMTDPEHPNSPGQKYRTTPEGLDYARSSEGEKTDENSA